MIDYSQLSQEALKSELLNACISGNINFIKQIVNTDLVGRIPSGPLCYQLGLAACANDKTDIIKCLMDSPELHNRINREHYITEYFKIACANGRLKTVEYLSTADNINRENPKLLFSIGLTYATRDGKLNITKYLLEHFKDLINEDVIKTGQLVNTACEYGELEILKYLHSINILNKDNIHQDDDANFRIAYDNNKLEIIRYFIFDLNMDKTEDIKQILSEKKNKEIEHMFALRDLNKELHSDLEVKQSINKKLKV
jgi:hypothetical protein